MKANFRQWEKLGISKKQAFLKTSELVIYETIISKRKMRYTKKEAVCFIIKS